MAIIPLKHSQEQRLTFISTRETKINEQQIVRLIHQDQVGNNVNPC